MSSVEDGEGPTAAFDVPDGIVHQPFVPHVRYVYQRFCTKLCCKLKGISSIGVFERFLSVTIFLRLAQLNFCPATHTFTFTFTFVFSTSHVLLLFFLLPKLNLETRRRAVWYRHNNGSRSVIVISYFMSCMHRSDSLRVGGPGVESRWGRDFSATVQTGPVAHPASYTVATGFFPEGKRTLLSFELINEFSLYCWAT